MNEKNVIITGSSIGIGRYTAYEFAKEGANVVITYFKDREEAIKTYENCLKLGMKKGWVFYLDLTDDESIKEFVKNIKEEVKRVDILINNAGVCVWKPLINQSLEEIEVQTRVNLEGLIKLTRLILPMIRDQIINISSGAGKAGFADLTVYCATKFGIRGFTQALAQELADIKVFCVNPGMTATRMTNFQGVAPEKVAKVILNTAKGIYKKPSGSDIDVWEYI